MDARTTAEEIVGPHDLPMKGVEAYTVRILNDVPRWGLRVDGEVNLAIFPGLITAARRPSRRR